MRDPHSGRCVRLARRTQTATAHFYRQDRFSDSENRRAFGACYTPHGHGHNYMIEAVYVGRIDSRTGIVENLIDVDRVLRQTVEPMEHRHLNFDVPFFRDQVPTTENVARFVFERLVQAPFPAMALELVRVYEDEDIWAERRDPTLALAAVGDREARAALERAFSDSRPLQEDEGFWTLEGCVFGQHSLRRPDLGDEENERLYGACYRLHGHDYRPRATIRGRFDSETGLFVDRERVSAAFDEAIVRPFHGRNLNLTMANTSCEALACEWFDRLEKALRSEGAQAILEELSIQETRKNWFSRSRDLAIADRP